MKRRKMLGVAGTTYFSEDGEWTILTLKPGQHRLFRKQQPVGDFLKSAAREKGRR
ncbi:hypothetical protein [Mycobacterium noviomagense]|uniref:Uncharacterized protein n=1 Tax=Mycobacterium noviomagense TaxID=459858 RepID=A0A7I7PGK9_9MYCO|nr:hypothetical protein [Mycobacterium noviomagense]BBY07710.1 hypothetical protein MNVI_30280 [Mycobacterium noviomagense]